MPIYNIHTNSLNTNIDVALDTRVFKVLACTLFLIIGLLTSCSNSNPKTPSTISSESGVTSHSRDSSTIHPEAESDDGSCESQVSSLETAAVSELTVFEKLATDMVCVEQDASHFYICKYEVTQRLWSEVMGNNPSEMQGDDLPVEQVSWNDCQTFIAKLNELTGKSYRLPTVAEWEFACRGGRYSRGYAYSGSDDIDKVAWYDGNSEGRTHPVGQKQPNELGLYDMSGNVWELCEDLIEGDRVCRGGSWIHNARNCDPSLNNETPQGFWINSLGLRLAL